MSDGATLDPEARQLLGRYPLPAARWPVPLTGAVGDALGRVAEHKSPAELRTEVDHWWSELEYRDDLIGLADDLARFADASGDECSVAATTSSAWQTRSPN